MDSHLTPVTRQVHEERIRKACPILHPTGCTPHFCGSGSMCRPQEPRVGLNRSILTIKAEANAFLQEMYNEGLFANRADFEERLEEVNVEIAAGAIHAKVWEDRKVNIEGSMQFEAVAIEGITSAGWTQTRSELEWGLRTSWRNARKCIMRAHHMDLKLIDLRHITTSRGMIDSIIEHLPTAYNGGRIQPTVFMFPPRPVNGTGAMFWSPQLLTFAGYSLPNGEILGDPANVQITKDIMDLGWNPPEPKSRWDILPIVAMAENDEPAWGVLPPEIKELVEIRHPKYPQSFKEMGLKWGKFPAMCRLGFDIGGVQYTASPFVGWFMDAEIGVRDLTDSFRYNVLPEVVEAIGWRKQKMKAQTELNFAVYCSYKEAGVSCVNTLTASKSWHAFDDQHLEEKGYRLNADPYWIAPPQGSIIPLWHRGSAPNYQPKPLIARHQFDPVKVWKRRNGGPEIPMDLDKHDGSHGNTIEAPQDTLRVHILHSGTVCTALTLAERLRRTVQKEGKAITLAHFGTLNSISPVKICPNDTLLIVISSTGSGQIPANGQHFSAKIKDLQDSQNFPLQFAVFGIGDSGYHQTFNGGAITVTDLLLGIGAKPIISNGLVKSDVSLENPPLSSFQSWWDTIAQQLHGERSLDHPMPEINTNNYQQELAVLTSYKRGIVSFGQKDHKSDRVMKLSLEVDTKYSAMSHIRLLPCNPPNYVARVISLLGINDPTQILTKVGNGVTIHEFLTDYADLYQPFRALDWVSTQYSHPDLISTLSNSSAIKVLEIMFASHDSKPLATLQPDLVRQILFSMTTQRPRLFSIASFSPKPNTIRSTQRSSKLIKYTAEILLKIIPSGRFSFQTLTDIQSGSTVLYKLETCSTNLPLLKLGGEPIVAVTCGTGFGPINSLLQKRMQGGGVSSPSSDSADSFDSGFESGNRKQDKGKITLFAGFKQEDSPLFTSLIDEAGKYELFDGVYLVPTSHNKGNENGNTHVQDLFEGCKEELVRKLGEESGRLYICGNPLMVEDVKRMMEECLKKKLWRELVAQGRVLGESF